MGMPTKLRALVVDDMQVNRVLLGKLLQSFGFDVTYSADGQEAVERFLRQDISCVWMDINMPGMDGLQASRQIRSIEAAQGQSSMTSKGSEESLSSSYAEEQVVLDARSSCSRAARRVPIVGVSACSLTEQLKSAALEGLPITDESDCPWELCGMDFFVEKPINRSKLECILDQLQNQLGMQSAECSSSGTPEASAEQSHVEATICCPPAVLDTECTVSSPVAKRGLGDEIGSPAASPAKRRRLGPALSTALS